jgi:dienelactone hydrolase
MTTPPLEAKELLMLAAPVKTSLDVLEMAQAGQFDDIREMFAAPLRAMVTAEALEAVWKAEVDRLGPITSVGAPLSEPAPGGVVVKVPVTCERGGLTLVVSVTSEGQLTSLQLASPGTTEPIAPWKAPAYADPSSFEEEDVTLGSSSLAVPGTMSLPRRSGPHPAVVLLAGSGPLDRDETIGPNKPFKDLAWGLASRGVAVLRFDKVTFAHSGEVRANAEFTLTDEYVPQAIDAIAMLRGHPSVDPARIFVAGHSMGGTVAPRVAEAEPAVAGLIVLAGGAQPLHWVIVRQIRYLASLDPETGAASEQAIEVLTRQAQLVDSPNLSASTPASELPMGAPASYWLDLRGYEPAVVAAALGQPMLVLQGGRDYQATVADDLARWQEALAGRADVTVRVYPADNHFFFVGSGPSTPQESMSAQHVDPTVVADIAEWLKTVRVAAAGVE